MVAAPVPPDEAERLEELHRYEILDSARDASFEAITHLAQAICGTTQAYVTLVDRDREWFKVSRGPLGPELPREVSFCAHTILGRAALIVADATRDPRFAENPIVVGPPKIRFYAGVPLLSSHGQSLGALCVMDEASRQLTPDQHRALAALGRQVEIQLDLRRLLLNVRKVRPARHGTPSGIPSNLLAVAVHDLKNPLIASLAACRFLLSNTQDPEQREAAVTGVESVETAFRMLADLLDVVIADGGVLRTRPKQVRLDALFERLGRHLEWTARERELELTLPVEPDPAEAFTDPDLVRRILENLIDNAFKYAGKGKAVEVAVRAVDADRFQLVVSDQGRGVDERFVETIFRPHTQLQDVTDDTAGPSRGLGLYFCRLAAEALGGGIHVEANQPSGARFVVTLPRDSSRRAAAGLGSAPSPS